LLSREPKAVYLGLAEEYPQNVSVIADFLPVTQMWNTPVYIPKQYETVVKKIYGQFKIKPEIADLYQNQVKIPESAELNLNISYESNVALIIVEKYGQNFELSLNRMLNSIQNLNLNASFVDIPLRSPWVDAVVEILIHYGFIFAGVMPFIHKNGDHLRMQKAGLNLDFNYIKTYSEMAGYLKKFILKEYHAIQKK
ncbi:MAG: hypothetical protein ACFCU6_06365, partial [Balneolaceae bacterium]